MNNIKNILWGIILVIIGVIIGLNTIGITDIDIFFDGWWTLVIIVPCFIGLFTNKDKTGNIIGLLVGVILLLGMQNIIDFNLIWKLLLPSIIVIIGLSLIFKNTFNSKINNEIKKLYKSNHYPKHNKLFLPTNIFLFNHSWNACNQLVTFRK